MPLTLDAVDLYSRFGFGDGDILEIMTNENLTEEQLLADLEQVRKEMWDERKN